MSIKTFGEAIMNLKGQIDSLLPEGPVIICFIIPLCLEDTQRLFLLEAYQIYHDLS